MNNVVEGFKTMASKKKTDIDVADVVTLIRAHCENDEVKFKETARKIASEFEKNEEDSQLAHYIWGLIGDEPTWVPMDEITTDINIKMWLREIEKLTELLDVPNCDGLPADRTPQFAVSHSRVAVHIRRAVKRCLVELGEEDEKETEAREEKKDDDNRGA